MIYFSGCLLTAAMRQNAYERQQFFTHTVVDRIRIEISYVYLHDVSIVLYFVEMPSASRDF